MTTEMAERIVKYSGDDIRNIMDKEGLNSEDITFLSSISTFGLVGKPMGSNVPVLSGLMTADIPVFHVSSAPTGIYDVTGRLPVIVLNEERSVLDYDLISELHPNHDWDVYLWLTKPWVDAGTDFGIHGEWYRSDVYPDGIEPFNGTLGWADIVVQED